MRGINAVLGAAHDARPAGDGGALASVAAMSLVRCNGVVRRSGCGRAAGRAGEAVFASSVLLPELVWCLARARLRDCAAPAS